MDATFRASPRSGDCSKRSTPRVPPPTLHNDIVASRRLQSLLPNAHHQSGQHLVRLGLDSVVVLAGFTSWWHRQELKVVHSATMKRDKVCSKELVLYLVAG